MSATVKYGNSRKLRLEQLISPKSSNEVSIGLVQMRMVADHDKNLSKAIGMIEEAAEKGSQIVCLPELFCSRYFPKHEASEEAPEPIPGLVTRTLSKAARGNGVILVGGSIYEKVGKKAYNTSVVFDERGKLLGKYRKVHVPQDPSFFEQNYFSKGNQFSVFKTKYARIGSLICFDQWYPEAARIEKLKGAEIIFYPTAIGWVKGIEPVEGDWHEAWEKVQVGHAISNSVIVASANRVGREEDMIFWGGSFVCDQFGKILVRANDKEGVFIAKCDLSLGKNVEEGWGFLRNRKTSTYGPLAK
jgi:predicted amidohydrolase